MPGTLFVVATPIGNLEDITARALRVLREASIIAAEDTRRTANLLARYAIITPTTSLHEHNEAQKSASIVARLERGENVALVSDAGTPTISDPGQRLIRTAIDAGSGSSPSLDRAPPSRRWRLRACPATRLRSLDFPRLGQKPDPSGLIAPKRSVEPSYSSRLLIAFGRLSGSCRRTPATAR